MGFLDHCEAAARLARQEAALSARLAAARGDAGATARVLDELEAVRIEKRFAVLRALDSAGRPGGTPPPA